MGFSTSAVVLIFAAALMYMAALFYPMAETSHRNVVESEKISNQLWSEKLNTKISITDWTGYDITVYNNGSIALNSSKINIILNGKLQPTSYYTINPVGVWPPKTSIDVNVGASSGSVEVVAANGAADYFRK